MRSAKKPGLLYPIFALFVVTAGVQQLRGESPYLHNGLILSLGFAFWVRLRPNPTPLLPSGRSWLFAALALLLVLGAFAAAYYLSFNQGFISFSYADPGHDPAFREKLKWVWAVILLAAVFGADSFFRGFIFTELYDRLSSSVLANLLQAGAWTLWLLLGLRGYLGIAEPRIISLYLFSEFAAALLAGAIRTATGSTLFSGLWTGFHLFMTLHVLNDVEFNLKPAFYLVSSTSHFYLIKSALFLCAAGALHAAAARFKGDTRS